MEANHLTIWLGQSNGRQIAGLPAWLAGREATRRHRDVSGSDIIMAFAPVFRRPFSATFDRRAAAAGNGLLNALIAYWPGNEASGDLLDAHTHALHLTDTNVAAG